MCQMNVEFHTKKVKASSGKKASCEQVTETLGQIGTFGLNKIEQECRWSSTPEMSISLLTHVHRV